MDPILTRELDIIYFTGVNDNIVRSESTEKMSVPELYELFLSDPIIADNKEDVPLFLLSKFNLDKNTFVPAKRQISSVKDHVKINDGYKVYEENGRTFPSRSACNIVHVDAIILDFDDGTKIDDIKMQLKSAGLTHVGYTSYSHRKDATADYVGTDKFRVILPLLTSCPRAEWDLRKKSILKFFPTVDHSTINTSRSFYLPSCPSSRAHLAQSWYELGDMFDWNWLEKEEVRELPKPVAANLRSKQGVGPVVLESFDAVAFFIDQGLYLGSSGGNKHNVICPNHQEHTGQATSGTVLFQDGTHFPTFYCSHSHCTGFKVWQHFKSQLGQGWLYPYCERRNIETRSDFLKSLKR